MATGVLDPAEVQVGTANGPGIYLAPASTPGPADTTEDWAPPWSCLGYLSDDGPTVGQSTDSADITPWQSVVPIRSVITSRGVTVQFTMWQLNAETIALYFDGDMPVEDEDGSMEMDVRTDSAQHVYAVGIDTQDADRVMRIVFPRASLTDVGDMQIQRGAAIPLDVTLSALDDGGSLAKIRIGPSSRTGAGGGQQAASFDVVAEAVARHQEADTKGQAGRVPRVSRADAQARAAARAGGTGGGQ